MEHHSAPNRNMAIRQLEYDVDLLDKYMKENEYDVHEDAFIPFFEGDYPISEYYEERLSDHFKIKSDKPSIELINRCYHLGDKMNMELRKVCPALGEYHWLCCNIQENAKKLS